MRHSTQKRIKTTDKHRAPQPKTKHQHTNKIIHNHHTKQTKSKNISSDEHHKNPNKTYAPHTKLFVYLTSQTQKLTQQAQYFTHHHTTYPNPATHQTIHNIHYAPFIKSKKWVPWWPTETKNNTDDSDTTHITANFIVATTTTPASDKQLTKQARTKNFHRAASHKL